MDERTAGQLAVIVGGEAWQSGGGIWLVTVTQDDGSLGDHLAPLSEQGEIGTRRSPGFRRNVRPSFGE